MALYILGKQICHRHIKSRYKYLGVILDEHLNFKECSETLAALCKIIGKFKTYKDLKYNTFTKLYNTCVWPILDYCYNVW